MIKQTYVCMICHYETNIRGERIGYSYLGGSAAISVVCNVCNRQHEEESGETFKQRIPEKEV